MYITWINDQRISIPENETGSNPCFTYGWDQWQEAYAANRTLLWKNVYVGTLRLEHKDVKRTLAGIHDKTIALGVIGVVQ